MAVKQFAMPDVGEGLTEGEVLRWHVAPGDTVTDGQIIVEVETAKAAVELPCPYDGVVTELLAAEGATVDVGAPIIAVDTAASGAEPPAPPSQEDEFTAVLVGSGPKTGSVTRRARRTDPAPAPAEVVPAPAAEVVPAPATVTVLAKPPVRKLARDRGVDLASLVGTGRGGTITRADVEAATAGTAAPASLVPVEAGVREERIDVRGVRKHTAAAMVSSAFTAPHVTEFLTLDITPTMALRDRVAASREFAGVKVSPLLFVAKALLLAVRRHPMVNSSWDDEREQIVVKHYVNLGIAAATDRGLVVPNVKDADRLSLRELADALTALTETARAGKATPADLAGGTISITNVGVFGIDTGTPILPPGETAILAFGAVREQPWVVDGAVVPRQVTTLALSFDHRIVDGQLGSQFLADIGAVLADPAMALALG